MGNCCQVHEGQQTAEGSAGAAACSKNTNGANVKKLRKLSSTKVSLNRGSIGSIHENITITDHTRFQDRDVFDYYDKVKVIGEGSTCTIYEVRKKQHASNGSTTNKTAGATCTNYQLLALKEISKDRVDELFLKEMRNEVAILRTLDHPNIVRVYDMFESKRAIYMVMEYCKGGDLFTRVPYTEAQAAKIMTKLLSAIAYCHERKIIHRDLKMENAMFESKSEDAEIKLIDFGLSKMYLKPSKWLRMNEICGTPYTMSPQVIKKRYNEKADVWACGCIAFILLSNKRPFDGKSVKEVADKIVKYQWDKKFEGPEWAHISADAKKFVSSLLVYDENDRKSAAQALRSPWLNKTFSLDSRRPEDEVMSSVTNALIHSANEGKFKKLAMQVIAYNSSTSEIEKLRNAFDAFDTDNEGTINYLEFKKALSQCNYSENDIKKIFSSIDVNQTGVINYTGELIWNNLKGIPRSYIRISISLASFASQHNNMLAILNLPTEFIAATLETRGLIEDESILTAFDKLDSDNTGFISKENLCSILGDKCSAQDCDTIIKELMEEVDSDGDGQISYEEFFVMFRERQREGVEGACCSSPETTL